MKDNQAISLTKQDLPYIIQINVFQKMESSKLITKQTIFFHNSIMWDQMNVYIWHIRFLLGSC